jgi:hypothetical protein
MKLTSLNPRKSLNKAFLKVKPNRIDIEKFKANLLQLFSGINDSETEEFHKNLISDFLKKSYYDTNYFINTKGRNDLVIHNGNTAKSSVGVIIEAKKGSNKSEMITREKLNVKAFQELILYYLRERIKHKNVEIKNLIITNIYEWFIFDANLFETLFAKSKNLIRQFDDFENGRLSGNTTDFFYIEIAKPFIDSISHEIDFTYFDIRSYRKALETGGSKDDNQLISLFKIFSPEHLLKLPFTNDSNTLDKHFYTELLHIIGLTETNVEGKKLIERNKENERHSGTMLEDAIIQLDSLDKIRLINKTSLYGETYEERLFNVALTLSITWINRILFLKLLEAQLVAYHKGEKAYAFLNLDKIKGYDDLNRLFFQVLARRCEERTGDLKKKFEKIPYLNSSLFEPTGVEHQTLFISNLNGDKNIPILSATVLKDRLGKKRTGSLAPLEYLFEFLDAYDFSSEGSEEIQEENKTLINASVLGLIFEKINGYKDGSFFTPGVITMYMCRETLRKAVLQKFNHTKDWNCKDFDELYNKIEDKKEANKIINDLKIVDPAVGSGHFLVSALNEIIAIKNDLKILQDRNGRRLKDFNIEVENDELIITDEDGRLFEYNPNNTESQRVQEILFHEKETIIENCLFGVDINPNSVKICRLRLWIELLKNAYYKTPTDLETLPNIDINIKTGNSLISRFGLDSNLKEALIKSKWTIDSYRLAVDTYRNAKSKEEKREMERLIDSIKSNFTIEISRNEPKVKRLQKLKAELFQNTNQPQLFEMSQKEKEQWDKKLKKLTEDIQKLEAEIEEIKNNRIYENAFEWRFEFPEVLDNDGNFIGFDVVIGNPPYVQLQKNGGKLAKLFEKAGYQTFERTGDIYSLFYEKGYALLKNKGLLVFITSNKWMRAGYGESTRKFFAENTNPILLVDFAGQKIFDAATVDTNILMFEKDKNHQKTQACIVKEGAINNLSVFVRQNSTICNFCNNGGKSWIILNPIEQRIKSKIEDVGTPLKDWNINIYRGILTGYNEAFIIDGKKKDELIAEDPKSADIIRPILRGRDIKRYGCVFADLWLINSHNGIKEKGVKPINIDLYPAVKKYLDQYYPELKKRVDKGETPYNLRNCAYMDAFSKQKIIYPEITKFLNFYQDNNSFFVNNKCFILTGKYIWFLTAFLNSSLFKFCFRDNFPELLGGTRELRKIFIEQIPVTRINNEIEEIFKGLIENLHLMQNQKIDTRQIEIEIDNLIFDLYSLSPEEREQIGFIEIE